MTRPPIYIYIHILTPFNEAKNTGTPKERRKKWTHPPKQLVWTNSKKKFDRKKKNIYIYGIGATIRNGQEIECLPYAGFVLFIYFISFELLKTIGPTESIHQLQNIIFHNYPRWYIVQFSFHNNILCCTLSPMLLAVRNLWNSSYFLLEFL